MTTDTHEITLGNDQRVGLVGRTGMGKTFLVEHLVEGQPRVLAVDSKHCLSWPGYSLTFDAGAALLADHVIYRHREARPPSEFWGLALHSLHERGGGILYIDELPVITSADYIPPKLAECFRLGRELGVGVWWAGQEAVGVANTAIRQSDILVLFRNHGASDRDKLMRTCGDLAELTAHLKAFEFTVYESSGQEYDPGQIPVYTLNA